MKAVKKLIILAMACVFLCTQGIAISETDPTVPPLRHILDISLLVSPDEMVNGGDVTLTFVITNDSDFAANNLYMESVTGHHSESLGQLLPGESQTYTRTYTVSEAELDAGMLSFRLSHDDIISTGGEPVDYTIDALVSRADARADIEFTRQISNRYAIANSTVILTYRVENTGNVPLENVRVRDELGLFTAQAELLYPGEIKIFSNNITVEGDVTSEALVEYAAPSVSDDIFTRELDAADITLVESEVSVGLTLDHRSASPGDTVNGVVTIACVGADVSDITVYDDIYNTVIADTVTVQAGNTATLTCTWPVRDSTDYRVRIEGTDAAGRAISVCSGTASVKIDRELSEYPLSVAANAQTPVINTEGSARISIAITNSGNAPARDVVLSEETLGEIRVFEFVPAGDPTLRSIIVDVQEDTEYVFSVQWLSHDGNIHTEKSEPVYIRISPEGEDPIREPSAGGAEVYDIRGVSEYFWMIAGGGVLLIVLLILLILTHDREVRERKLRQKLGMRRGGSANRPRRDNAAKNEQ